MTGRNENHQMVLDLLFDFWLPSVWTPLGAETGWRSSGVEYQLWRHRGEPPERGHPPDWPEEAKLCESAVSSLGADHQTAIKYKVGVVDEARDITGKLRPLRDRLDALGWKRSTFHSRVRGALNALWRGVLRDKAVAHHREMKARKK